MVQYKQHKERSTFIRVFYSVFVEFFTDISKSIFGFFKRYIILIWNCLKFIWRPDAEYHEKAKDKTLTNAKYTFQFILIITSITIFLIKQNIIQSTDDLKEAYGNDIIQYMLEFMFFLGYVILFFLVMSLLVLIGRVLRKIFKPIETRDVTDKVFIHLNNIFFLLITIYAFMRKFNPTDKQLLADYPVEWMINLFWFLGIPLFIVVFTFFIRLVIINHAKNGKAIVYGLIVPLIIYILFIAAFFTGI